MTARFAQWCQTESQYEAMLAEGWTCDPKQEVTHHHFHSVLMEWNHEDRDPPSLATPSRTGGG